jgi:hypothetical protein
MYRFVMSVALFSLLVISVPPAGAQDADVDADPGTIRLDWAGPGIPGPVTGPAADAMLRGPLPADAEVLAERKAIAAEAAGKITQEISPEPYAPSPTPVVLLGKAGIFDTGSTPSDSTGAIGNRRYIETVNSKVGIYDLSLGLLAQDILENWWNVPVDPNTHVFDPQVMWDASTNRFYYAGDIVFSSSDNRLAFGFSKTASPNNATTDWCHYNISYGSEFPDYPKLGDSRYFAVIGVNVFTAAGPFRGSDIIAISKPPVGTTCPDPETELIFKIGKNIKVGTGLAFTPVPANSIDSNSTAWVVTRSLSLPSTEIGLFKVTRNATTGVPVIQVAGSAVTVQAYDVPPNAPQKDTQFLIDTMDARMTQAVAAIDPGHSNKFAVWTQHTISGGAGARVRWYEIGPVGKTILQTGNVQNSTLYYFNGAVSPDRVVKGTTTAYGDNMALNFTASSGTTYPAIKMVSKRGASGISAVKTVKSSPGPDIDFACPDLGYCRWGDYAAATPDPNAPTGAASGIVWGSSMWTKDGRTDPSGVSWRTWNWKSQP